MERKNLKWTKIDQEEKKVDKNRRDEEGKRNFVNDKRRKIKNEENKHLTD